MAFTFKHGDRPLDGYEIQRAVGRGGFGEVYYAISDGGREVALKYLREHPEVELRGIAQCINLKSPHLVSIFDVKQNAAGEYFVVMEYVSGPSLRDMLIAEPRGLGPQKGAFFVREIAKGLAYLHDRGIVHRDLKPANIFYDEGYVKICDYGLSKFISVSRHSAQTTSIGTVHYMAPEVGSGNYSKTIDIYALGVILYEMLLGRVPYEGASMGEILMKHLTQQPEVDELPQPFAAVIRRALAKAPEDRYPHVSELVDNLFDVADVKNSVLGFEPAGLTRAAVRGAVDLRPSPVPSGGPRQRVRQSAEQFSKRFVNRTVGLDARVARREPPADGSAKRKRQAPSPARRPGEAPLLGKDQGDAGPIRSPYHVGFGQRLARLFAALLVVAGLGLAAQVLTHNPALMGVSVAIIMVAVVGMGVGNKLATWMGPDHPELIRRLVVLVCAAPAAGVLFGAVVEAGVGRTYLGSAHQLNLLYLPLLISFLLFDWREDIHNGMRGEFKVWGTILFGCLMGVGTRLAFQDLTEEACIWMGGLSAGIALALQAFSWALVPNPRPVADGRVGDPLSAGDDPADAGHHEQRFAADPELDRIRPSRWLEQPPANHRGKTQRTIAGVLAFGCALGVIALAILLGVGEIRGRDDEMGAVVGITALGLMFLFFVGKSLLAKRVGLWNEWFNPLLRVVAGVLFAIGISGAVLQGRGDLPGFVIVAVLGGTMMLPLLIFRGGRRRSGNRQHQASGAWRGAPGAFDPAEARQVESRT